MRFGIADWSPLKWFLLKSTAVGDFNFIALIPINYCKTFRSSYVNDYTKFIV